MFLLDILSNVIKRWQNIEYNQKYLMLIYFFNSFIMIHLWRRRDDATRRDVASASSSRRCHIQRWGYILAIASTWHDESSCLILGRCTSGMLNARGNNITVPQCRLGDVGQLFFFFFIYSINTWRTLRKFGPAKLFHGAEDESAAISFERMIGRRKGDRSKNALCVHVCIPTIRTDLLDANYTRGVKYCSNIISQEF